MRLQGASSYIFAVRAPNPVGLQVFRGVCARQRMPMAGGPVIRAQNPAGGTKDLQQPVFQEVDHIVALLRRALGVREHGEHIFRSGATCDMKPTRLKANCRSCDGFQETMS